MAFDRFLRPRSIAAFGGSEAEEVIRQCDRMGFEGELWPVHPNKKEILGRKVYRSVEDLPSAPDAAHVAVNRYLTIDIVRALAARGAGGAVCFATGFTEAGDEGAELEKKLEEASGEMTLLGPNCYGMLNYLDGAMLWPDQQGGRRVESGVAIVTMSSNVAFNLTMQRRGLPIAYVLSLGNRLRFGLAEAIRTFAREKRVTAIGLYLEGISDPHAFEQAVGVARDLGKSVVAIKTGRSETARKMAFTHAASLAGSDELMDALFDRVGVARVRSLEELVEALKVLHVHGPLPGGQLGVMSSSGGDLALVGDATIGTSLELPALSTEGEQRVRETVHERIVAANPFDYQMFDWNNEERLTKTFAAFVSDPFDLSLCLLDYPRSDLCDASTWSGAERAFVRVSQPADKRTGVLSTLTDNLPESLATHLIDEGVVPLAGIDTGLAGIQAAVEIGAIWKRPASPPLFQEEQTGNSAEARLLDEAESKRLLADYGLVVPPSKVVCDAEQAASAAETLGYPVVVKALGIAHKTDRGGVRLALDNAAAVAAAVVEMARIGERFLVETMIEGSVAELIVGVARDESFGPHLVVGAGGILVELMKDSRPLLLPTSHDRVAQALQELRCSPLFVGFRGRPRADVDAAIKAILAIGNLVETQASSILELDINPLILLSEGRGVVVADALIRMS